MTSVLVTGAAGNIGSRVVSELRNRGAMVRAFVRDPGRAASCLAQGVEMASGDYDDPASVERALNGMETVLLLAPNHPRQAEWETAVIDAASAHGVQRLVKISTIGAKIGSPSAFWDAHGRIERHLQASGVPAVTLQSSFYMSGLLASAEPVRQLGKLFTPLADARIGMVDPRDVAAVAAQALTSSQYDGMTLTLTGPESITHAQIAEQLATVTGRPVEFVNVPDHAAQQNMLASGVPPWVVEQLGTLFGLLRGGAADLVTDTVRNVTGREPRSFAQFARDHAAQFRA